MTLICVGKLTIIGSDIGLSPGRRIEIDTFSFKKMHLKMSSAKWQPFCLGLNVLILLSLLLLSCGPGLGPEYLVLVLVVLEYLISVLVLVLVLRPFGT